MAIEDQECHFIVTSDRYLYYIYVSPREKYFVENLTELFKTDYSNIIKVLIITPVGD